MYPTGVDKLSFKLFYLFVGKNSSLYFIVFFFPLQSTTAQSFSQKNGTTETVGLVYWPHPDDLTAMEDSDWPIRPTGTWGAKR